MRYLLIFLLAVTSLISCQPAPIPMAYSAPMSAPVVAQPVAEDYQVMTSPTGARQVVFVDNGVSQVMEYALFMSLFNNGGYGNVVHHYHEPYYHTNVYRSSNYSRWRSNRVVYNRVPQRQPGTFGAGRPTYTPRVTSNTLTRVRVTPAPSTPRWRSTTTASSYRPMASSRSSSRTFGGGRRK